MRLTRFEDAWAKAALAGIFPGSPDPSGALEGGAGLAGIAAMDVSGYLASAMRTWPWKAALALRVAVWVVAMSPVFVLRRFSTVGGLDDADRDRLVARLSASPSYALRSLVTVLKTFGAMLYVGDDRMQARLVARVAPRVVPLVALRRKRADVA